ncbi:MAG: hypothetical protein Q8M15_14590 [Bacteroidota bacterium]|nr:hypothetical protein [Bacteroidota bacterium]
MKKQRIPYEHKASTREYLVALSSFPKYLKLLHSNDKPYKGLLDWLIDKRIIKYESYERLPSIKELSKTLNLDASRVTKYLKIIYYEIHELNENEPRLFCKEGQILCDLRFFYLGAYASFSVGFDVLPRVDEQIDFYFIKPRIGSRCFHVDKIFHDMSDTGHSIMLSLTSDYPNTYLKLLKEKAYIHRQISFGELIGLDHEYEFEEKLINYNRNL